jgi:hypothetical protein
MTPGMPAPASGYEQGVEAAIRLLECLLTNDPDEFAADGITVLDVWRKDAERALPKLCALSSAPPAPELPAEIVAAVKLAAFMMEHVGRWPHATISRDLMRYDEATERYVETPLGRALLERAGRLP